MRIIVVILLPLLLMSCGQPAPSLTGGAGGAMASTSSSADGSSSSGPVACGPGTKTCGDACAPIDSPATGCAGVSCSPCSYPNGTATCAGGACALASCVQGWADCDSATGNGCETHTATDLMHCGGCSSACSIPHAISTCIASACEIKDCLPGFGNCDGNLVNGCEKDIFTSPNTCGGCQVVCPVDQGCTLGLCHSCDINISGGLGAGNIVGAAPPDALAWSVTLTQSLVAKALALPAVSSTYPWVARLYKDSGGKPGGGVLATQASTSTMLSIPVALSAGVVYWITAGVNTTNPAAQIIVNTKMGGPSPVGLYDGVLLQPVTPPQSPTSFGITGACP